MRYDAARRRLLGRSESEGACPLYPNLSVYGTREMSGIGGSDASP